LKMTEVSVNQVLQQVGLVTNTFIK
jgi:hypothetical protein